MERSTGCVNDSNGTLIHRILGQTALWCLLLIPAALPSAEARARCLKDVWIKEPTAFVTEVMNGPLPDVCIRFVTQQGLNTALPWRPHGLAEEAASAFLPRSSEILLADDFDFKDAVSRSYLVHELVHALQYARGSPETVSCVGLLEGEAYAAQASYLRRYALKNEAFLFQVMGILQSACGIDY